MKANVSYGKLILIALVFVFFGLLLYRYVRIDPVPTRVPESTRKTVRENYTKYSKLSFVPIDDTANFREKMNLAINNALSTKLTKELKNQLSAFLVEILVSKKTGNFALWRFGV